MKKPTRSPFALTAGLMIALAMLLLTGCDGGTGGGKADGDVIKVGEYGSMTGSEATFGQSTHKGIMLAVNEINAAGGLNGKKIQIISEDDQGKSEEVGKVVKKLIESDKVVALLGEVASSLSMAGGRLAQQYGVPMITPSSTNPKVTQIGDMVFRVCFTDDFQGYAMAKFAHDNLGKKTAAIFYDQKSAYSTGLRDFIEADFTKMGGTIVAKEAYTAGDSDFNAQLTSIRAKKPDVLFIPGYYTDVGNIAIQARRLNVDAIMIGGDGWDSSKLPEIGGQAIEGQYFANHCSYEDPGPKAFKEKYMAAYNGEVPDALAALGYDSAMLLFDAMKRAKSLNGKDLAKAIAETKDYQGVTGKTSIDEKRNAAKPAAIIQIKDGKPIPVAQIPMR